jgi:hypothetical protein
MPISRAVAEKLPVLASKLKNAISEGADTGVDIVLNYHQLQYIWRFYYEIKVNNDFILMQFMKFYSA